MATAKCSQTIIESALGANVRTVMPELVRLAELRVRIPRYEIVMLAKLAAREQTTVDDFLAQHLLDLAAAKGDWLNELSPEFAEAARWPAEN
jgi:hypothetical protein